jgi:ankyrin repeat protein
MTGGKVSRSLVLVGVLHLSMFSAGARVGAAVEEAPWEKQWMRLADVQSLSDLHQAAEADHAAMLRVILRAQPERIAAPSEDGLTPLQSAALRNAAAAAQFLLRWGAVEDVFSAAGLGHADLCAAFVQDDPTAVTARDPAGGETPLRWAARSGHSAAASVFLAAGAEHDVFTATGFGDLDELQRLVAADPELVRARDRDSQTPLHWAARLGRTEIAQTLMNHGADIDAVDKCNRTPLYVSVAWASERTAQVLLDAGAAVDVAAVYDFTDAALSVELLEMAAKLGSAELVRRLLGAGARPGNALTAAVGRGDLAVVQELLAKGAGVPDGRGTWALVVAVIGGRSDIVQALLAAGVDATAAFRDVTRVEGCATMSTQVAELLLAAGADVNRAADGALPLHGFAAAGNTEMVRFLVSHGADPGARGRRGRTALHDAAMYGHCEVAEELLRSGADATAAADAADCTELLSDEVRGTTVEMALIGEFRRLPLSPLHLAAANGRVDMVNLLITAGADPNGGDCGLPPLHCALWNRHYDVVRSLLFRGADADARDARGASCVHAAVEAGDAQLLGEVVGKGGLVGACDGRGRTPLHRAAWLGAAEAAVWLLRNGADPTSRDDLGRTPLHMACACREAAVAGALLLFGADPEAKDNDGERPDMLSLRTP